MTKVISTIIIFFAVIVSFIAGVKYSDNIKNHAGWLFESKEDEVELPQLEDEEVAEDPAVYDQQMMGSEGADVDASANQAADTTNQADQTQPANANVEQPAQGSNQKMDQQNKAVDNQKMMKKN